ncbi:hypothetical protein TNCV_3964321 [Trichonephila clavipes]|nr:hypothetical protein TNCV_3964321 [Trichonephila clavipes]
MVLDDHLFKVKEITKVRNMSKERVCHILNQHLGKIIIGAYYVSLLDKLQAEFAEKQPHLQKKKNPVSPRQSTVSHLSSRHGENPRIMCRRPLGCPGSQERSREGQMVSPADKRCRVYSLDPHPDSVGLYPGCTPGKPRACFFPDDRHTASLFGLRGEWRLARMKCFVHMDPIQLCPGKGLVLPTLTADQVAALSRFLLISLPNKEMSTKSAFVIHKALLGIGGEPKSIKRLRSGDLHI